jgi:hypothetical protein
MLRRVHIVIAAVLIALSTTTFIAAQNGASLNENLPSGAMQQKATTACVECHEARIILQQRLSKPAWTREVDKMVKWGAVVDPNDRDALIDYFSTNFGPDQPAYTPARSAREKTQGKNTAAKSGRQ